MDNNTAIIVAMLSFAAALFTALIGAAAVIWNGRSEKKKAAEATAEGVMNQRLLLRDEKIQGLREDKAELMLEVANLTAELDRFKLAQDEGRAEERERIDGVH